MPLQSPSPLFAIRAMVPLDIAFLADSDEYSSVYFEKFGAESLRHLRDVLNVSPQRIARSKVRALLECVRRRGLQWTTVDGRDLVTGGFPRDHGYAELQRRLDIDRTFRPLLTAIAFQPKGLGRNVSPATRDHLEWLWRSGHVLRLAAGTRDFIIRDGERLVAVVSASDLPDVEQVVERTESTVRLDGCLATSWGLATEGVQSPYSTKWTWDGTDCTQGASLVERAVRNLCRRDAAPEARDREPPTEATRRS